MQWFYPLTLLINISGSILDILIPHVHIDMNFIFYGPYFYIDVDFDFEHQRRE